MAVKSEAVYLLSCKNCDFKETVFDSLVFAIRKAEAHVEELVEDEMKNILHTIIVKQEWHISHEWN